MIGLLAALVACDPPSPPVIDDDRDGFSVPVDCDDADATVHPGAPERGDRTDHDCDGLAPPPPRDLADPSASPGSGYGRAVAQRRGTTWVGAPRAGGAAEMAAAHGAVTSDDGLSAARTTTGLTGALFGAALAVTDAGEVRVGAPGLSADAVGEVRDAEGVILLRAIGAGRVLTARGTRWATGAWLDATPAPTLDPTDARPGVAVVSDAVLRTWALARPPDSLALLDDGRVVAGFRSGPVAVQLGDITVRRAEDGDEAGAAIAVCDHDGDGDEELIVGAPGARGGAWGLPGAGAVWVLDPSRLPAALTDVPPVARGEGRLGAAVTCGDPGTVYAGAPMAGAALEGIVRRLSDPTPVEVGVPGAHLGAALATGDDLLVIGAPGGPGVPGTVRLRLR